MTDDMRTELPSGETKEMTQRPQDSCATGRETPQNGKVKIYRAAGCPARPGYNTLPRKRAHNKPSPYCSTHSYVKSRPLQQNYASNTRTRGAPAGRHAIVSQRPHPNRPPEQHMDSHMSQDGQSQPALGKARHK